MRGARLTVGGYLSHRPRDVLYRHREEAKATYGGDWNAEPAEVPYSEVPTAVALPPGQPSFPREWADRQGLNVKRFTTLSRGGHFAALDAPDVYARDVRESFAELASA